MKQPERCQKTFLVELSSGGFTRWRCRLPVHPPERGCECHGGPDRAQAEEERRLWARMSRTVARA